MESFYPARIRKPLPGEEPRGSITRSPAALIGCDKVCFESNNENPGHQDQGGRRTPEGATDVVNLLYRGLVYPAFEVVAGSYRQGVDFGLLSTRLQCSDEWAVLGSTDRWMYSFAVSGPKEGP